MKEASILIVEDDQAINKLLNKLISREGYRVKSAYSGTEGKMLLEGESYDLVILDLMLPGMTGEELLEEIRRESQVPIIIISAKISTEVKVDLLKAGADDFIEKPFNIEEVLARVEANLRRYISFENNQGNHELRHKSLVLNTESMTAMIASKNLKLTNKEFEILRLFLTYPKKLFTKANLLNTVWGESSYIDDNTLNVHISNLRNKIGQYDSEDYIETVWGIGFKLKN